MQQKFDEVFKEYNLNNEGESKMRRYTTQNYFRQILLLDIEGVNIINVRKITETDKEEIIFEFDDDILSEVSKVIKDCKNKVYLGKTIENFDVLKSNRKRRINEFYKSLNSEVK